MYRLREMDVDDKVCEQVELTMLSQVYPKEVIHEAACSRVGHGSEKKRRVRQSTVVDPGAVCAGMALWSRLNQGQVWQKLVGKLSDLHPAEPKAR